MTESFDEAGDDLGSLTPRSALAIYAHPDDPEVSCGGTLAKWSRRGTAVHVVVCTQGDKGSDDPRTDPAWLAARRAEEIARAGEVIGVSTQHLLGVPDGELSDDARLRGRLVELVRALKPEVVLCPDPEAVFFGPDYYNHRDHRAAGWLALDAVYPAAALPLYFPEAGEAHRVNRVYMSGSLAADFWVDITETIEVKVSAVACHASQVGDRQEAVAEAVRRRASDAAPGGSSLFSEGFRRLRHVL